MRAAKCRDSDYIDFLIASPGAFTCTEAARMQDPSPQAPAHDSFSRLLGRIDEAKPYVKQLLELEPNFTIAHFREVYPLKNDNDRDRYCEGLRLAGVPEG